jgi:predicted ribosomally synthesized peptide with SipW-like signal peptide
MTDDNFQLSRRQALTALGTVGVASVGAGFGTSAYFSDTESFDGNRMVAGELDLLVDWTEHYSDWMGAERDVEVSMTEPEESGYTPVPTADYPQLWVKDKAAFMEKTAIEAFPDTDQNGTANDGVQDTIPSDDECNYIRNYLTDGSGNWVSPLASEARTNGTVEEQTTNVAVGDVANSDPLVNLQDVKPGDFGEVTFSLHLCDNPGYVWMQGALDEELTSENGVNEPESEDPDEKAGVVELVNELRAAIWYDFGTDFDEDGYPWEGPYSDDSAEGDNVQQNGEPNLVAQGSLKAVLSALNSGMHGIALDADPASGTPQIPTTDTSSVGTTDFECTLYEKPERGIVTCADVNENWIEASKLEAGQLPSAGSSQTYSTSGGTVTITTVEDDQQGDPLAIEFTSDFAVKGVLIKGGKDSCAWQPVEADASTGTSGVVLSAPDKVDDPPKGDGVAEDDDNLDDNYAISNVAFCIEPDDGNGETPPNGDEERNCFEASTTASIGFAWWLPVDHANEIQTDTVGFDLGFYTEQCRHNDGSGQPSETADGTGS